MTDVARGDWHGALADLAAAGFAYLDLLTAIDRGEEIEVLVRVVDVTSAAARVVSTRVPTAALDVESIVDVFPGAAWHEREAAELFGLHFVGHPDPRPLITSGQDAPLLRKSTPLPARMATPWPGTDETARRRGRVPGVPETWTVSS